MKKVKINVPAKVNLTLDVLGASGGYHQIKSLVSSVSVFDTITLTKREDHRITLSVKGIKIGVDKTHNNAYIAAKMFMKRFGTMGVNIELFKRIPIGGGMGGSSADVVGVLLGMKKLFGVEDDLISLANELGSDTAYMLNGGIKVISGRGEIVDSTLIDTPLYFTALKCDKIISAKKCYSLFDGLNKTFAPCTDNAVLSLENKDFSSFCSVAKNDLYNATRLEVEEIDKNLSILKEVGAPLTIMTGSGTVVLGVYKDKKTRDNHFRRLKKEHEKDLLKFDTVILK